MELRRVEMKPDLEAAKEEIKKVQEKIKTEEIKQMQEDIKTELRVAKGEMKTS